MDLKTVDGLISSGMVSAGMIADAAGSGAKILDETWYEIWRVSAGMRAAARQDLAMNGISESAEGSILVLDSSKSFRERAQYAEERWLTMVKTCYNHLKAFDDLKSTNSEQALANLREFNARVPELEAAAKGLHGAYREAYDAAHPPAPGGPGPFGSTPGVPGYFAEAIQEINAKLDQLLDRVLPGISSSGMNKISGGVLAAASTESIDELLTLVREIAAWVRTQQGTGLPPVPQPIEGVVGEQIAGLGWRPTAGSAGVYGAPGQPSDVIGEWQYDALFRYMQTGTMLTVSVSQPTGGSIIPPRAHITRRNDGMFWLSVGFTSRPSFLFAVVITDIDSTGRRVVQRLTV